MAKPMNFTMFVDIFPIIVGILSTISGSVFQTITFFPSLVNYVVLQTINDCTINLLCYFLDLHLHYSKLACNFIPPPPLIFFNCLNPDILLASLVKYLLTFFFCFCLLILVSNYIFDISKHPLDFPYSTHTPYFKLSLFSLIFWLLKLFKFFFFLFY